MASRLAAWIILGSVAVLGSSAIGCGDQTHADIVAAVEKIEAVGGRVDIEDPPAPPGVIQSFANGRHYVLSSELMQGQVVNSVRFRADQPSGLDEFMFREATTPDQWPAKRSVRNEDLPLLAHFPRMEFVTLSNCQIDDQGLAAMRDRTELISLEIDGTRITDAGLPYLGKLSKLKYLELARTKVTDAGLKHLRPLTSLHELDLSGTAVTDAGLAELRHIPTLTNVDLSRTKVTDAGLAELQSLPELGTVWLEGLPVTDAGLKHLAAVEMLWTLILNETRVTDAGLIQLAGLKRLRYLSVRDTAVTDEGIEKLNAERVRLGFEPLKE